MGFYTIEINLVILFYPSSLTFDFVLKICEGGASYLHAPPHETAGEKRVRIRLLYFGKISKKIFHQ